MKYGFNATCLFVFSLVISVGGWLIPYAVGMQPGLAASKGKRETLQRLIFTSLGGGPSIALGMEFAWSIWVDSTGSAYVEP